MVKETLMTARDVARYLNCSASTVRRMAACGDIPHYRLGKLVRFRRNEIDAWLAQVHRGRAVTPGGRVPADPGQLSLFGDEGEHA